MTHRRVPSASWITLGPFSWNFRGRRFVHRSKGRCISLQCPSADITPNLFSIVHLLLRRGRTDGSEQLGRATRRHWRNYLRDPALSTARSAFPAKTIDHCGCPTDSPYWGSPTPPALWPPHRSPFLLVPQTNGALFF